jgi:tetratricopeptide (TPR) repeat protein
VAQTQAAEARLKAVAVLPCEETTGQLEQPALGDRWTEELIHKLVQVGALRPKAWLSVQRYRKTEKAAHEIGAELNAGTLVRCRIADEPATVRLAVELIRTDDERVIWSSVYDEPAGIQGVNAVQSAAALEIARVLGVQDLQNVTQAVGHALTQDSVALRLYRLGQHLGSSTTPEAWRRSIEYFNGAIARDSAFAQAYVALAAAKALLNDAESRPSREYYPDVARLLLRAIALDGTIAEAHSWLAQYLLEYAHDWISAEQEHRRALELSPSSVDVHLWYGWHLQETGRLSQAIEEFERAIDLDPALPLGHIHLGRALVFARKYDRALRESREAMGLEPDSDPLAFNLALLLLQTDRPDSAVAVLQRSQEPYAWWNGFVYGAAGRPDLTQRILDSLMTRSATQPVDPLTIATMHMGLGHKDEALTSLEQAYTERSTLLLYMLGPHIVFDSLRGEPRFQALRRRVGFAP